MSLRSRLEEKTRRRLIVPILVSDPSEDQAQMQTLHAAFQAATGAQNAEAAKGYGAELEKVAARVRSHWADVELQAMPRDEWRAATSAWQTVETTEDGPQVVTDWALALAPLLAESCVDEDLRDANWWAGQLARPEWSEGDTNALQLALLRLNVDAADPQVPKG
jgi:hypothetical protein